MCLSKGKYGIQILHVKIQQYSQTLNVRNLISFQNLLSKMYFCHSVFKILLKI